MSTAPRASDISTPEALLMAVPLFATTSPSGPCIFEPASCSLLYVSFICASADLVWLSCLSPFAVCASCPAL